MSIDHSTRARLIGAWELVSFIGHPSNPSRPAVYPLGESARGFILYTPDGYMSAQLQSPGQAPFACSFPADGTEAEFAEAARRSIAYSGAFRVEEDKARPVVVHHFGVSTFPNWIGEEQRRLVSFEGNGEQLVLSTESAIEVKVGYALPFSMIRQIRSGREMTDCDAGREI
jgi:hypothetical protein